MNYPLQLRFKIMAFAPQVFVNDAEGHTICYVKQQLFKLREKVRVFTDPSMGTLLAEINADKILDFSATYTFTDPQGSAFGAVRRQGMKSLWRAHYGILENGLVVMSIREGNPWTKVLDGIFGELPLIGLLSGYLFHPHYDVFDAQGEKVFTLRKQPAFLEGRFSLIRHREIKNDINVVLSVLMMTLLERRRG